MTDTTGAAAARLGTPGERRTALLADCRAEGADTREDLAGMVIYWQDVANHAHEQRTQAEATLARQAAALVQEKASALHYYDALLRLDNPPDTDECPQCGGKVVAWYASWYACWEADMEHDPDCPLEIAHSALGRRWTDESMARAVEELRRDGLSLDELHRFAGRWDRYPVPQRETQEEATDDHADTGATQG